MTATTLQLQRAAVVLSLATLITAQGPPSGFGGFGGSSDDDGSSSSSSSSSSDSNSNFDSSSFGSSNNNGGSNRGFGGGRFGDAQIMITAHAVLATLAFGFLFPVGGIMIRLGSFPGLWIVHGLFQIFAFLLYTAAFGIGVWMTRNFYTLNDAHPIIGIVVFALLVFQPLLGFLHHVFFKRYNARTIWSYGHIWFGRAVIILGIVNGGLGLGLAKRTGVMAPSNGAVIGYSVGAGVMGLAYLLSAWYGERKRSRSRTAAARANVPVKDGDGSSRNSSPRDAPRREYYKTERGYVRRASHSRHSGQRRMSRGQGYA